MKINSLKKQKWWVTQIYAYSPLNHVLFLVPAQVLSTPETAYLTLKQGEDALLECKVSGNPKPTVTWTKQVNQQLHGPNR